MNSSGFRVGKPQQLAFEIFPLDSKEIETRIESEILVEFNHVQCVLFYVFIFLLIKNASYVSLAVFIMIQ